MRLMGTLLCLPHTSAEHWRASSTLRKVKTRLHRLLNLKTLNFLPPIRMNKEKLCFDVWHSKELLEADEKVTASSRKEQARSLKASTTAQLQQAALSNKNYILSQLAGGLVMKCWSQQSLKICHPLVWLNGKKLAVYFQVLWKLEQCLKKYTVAWHTLQVNHTFYMGNTHSWPTVICKYFNFLWVPNYPVWFWKNILLVFLFFFFLT